MMRIVLLHSFNWLFGFLCLATLGACKSLDAVHQFADSSTAVVHALDDIPYSFRKHCLARCRFQQLKSTDLKKELPCDCADYQQADSMMQALQHTLDAYFNGLATLADPGKSSYSFEQFNQALQGDQGGHLALNSKQADAVTQLSALLLKAGTDRYRHRKIHGYIEQANAPVQLILGKLIQISDTLLPAEIDFHLQRLYAYVSDMQNDASLSTYEKQKVRESYFDEWAALHAIQN